MLTAAVVRDENVLARTSVCVCMFLATLCHLSQICPGHSVRRLLKQSFAPFVLVTLLGEAVAIELSWQPHVVFYVWSLVGLM